MKKIVMFLLLATGWLGAQQKMDLEACLKLAFENNYNLAIAQKQEDAARKGNERRRPIHNVRE